MIARTKHATRILIVLAALTPALSACMSDWRMASRESIGIAPLAADEPEAVVQVYAAATFGWRGWFADHTWVATKSAQAEQYTVYEVLGWRIYRGDPIVRIAQDLPDRKWFGSEPRILIDLRGAVAEAVAEKVDEAARSYPYHNKYRMWPGPNSNTFTAWIAHQVPELGLDLPPRAIGKSYPLEAH